MPSVFSYITSGSRCGNVPNHRAGPPFLDNHHHGFQQVLTDKQVACILKHTALGVCVCMHRECALTVSKSLFGFCVMKGGSQFTKKDLCS